MILSKELVEKFIQFPHTLGWAIGFKDLNELHSEWINYCWHPTEHRALQAFRGSYKSSSIVVVGTIRWWLVHPNDTIAIVRKRITLAQQFTEQIMKAMELPVIKDLFKYVHGTEPSETMRRAGSVSYNFLTKVTNVPSLTPLGIDSSATGLHFDRLIVDDIVALDDRYSRVERRRTASAVSEYATNILNPGHGAVWTGTPWHPDDAWQIIKQFTPIVKYPISKFNFFGPNYMEEKKKTTTPYLFAANYELELTKDESLLFASIPPIFGDWEIGPSLAHIDTAFDGDHYCALSIARYDQNGKLHVAGFVYAGNINDWKEKIVELCKQYWVKTIYVENNADKGAFHRELDKYVSGVVGYTEYGNKAAKIGSYLYPEWRNIIFTPETDKEYLDQIINWAEGVEPDDSPDSLASLCRQMVRSGGIKDEDINTFWRRSATSAPL